VQWASELDDDSDDDSDGDLGQYYPPKPIWRTENWGWKCRNEFATLVTNANLVPLIQLILPALTILFLSAGLGSL